MNGPRTYCGDCIDIMKGLPDDSIDLAILDPPYFRVMVQDKKGERYDWDDQWETFDEYIVWLNDIFTEVRRVLRPQGSIYCFADDLICAHVQICFERHFRLLNNIVWYKPNNMTIKGWRANRKYCPQTERILFGEQQSAPGVSQTGLQQIHSDPECFGPIREFFVAGKKRWMEDHNANAAQFDAWINEVTGTKSVASRHYFAVSQYVFPTFEHYAAMRRTGYWRYRGGDIREEYEGLREEYEGLREEYEGLREEYEGLREKYEELRRPFNPSRYLTDVWTFPLTDQSEGRIHPTQKPEALLERIISVSTRGPSDILDPFMGSGQAGRVQVRLGHRYTGIEKDPEMCRSQEARIRETDIQYRDISRLDAWGL